MQAILTKFSGSQQNKASKQITYKYKGDFLGTKWDFHGEYERLEWVMEAHKMSTIHNYIHFKTCKVFKHTDCFSWKPISRSHNFAAKGLRVG